MKKTVENTGSVFWNSTKASAVGFSQRASVKVRRRVDS